MKTKKPQFRTCWTALLAALGATAVMLPAHAQYQPESAGGQAPTSSWQPEMSSAPGQQGRDAGGSPGMGGSQGGMGAQGPQGMQAEQRALTREEVQTETEAWREAGLLDSMMQGDASSSWVSPEEQQLREQVSREVQSQRGGMEPPALGGGSGMGGR